MWWGWCWSYVSAQAACRERHRTTPNSPSTRLKRKKVDSSSLKGKEPGATGASRIGAARTTIVAVCQPNQAAVDTTSLPPNFDSWGCMVIGGSPTAGLFIV